MNLSTFEPRELFRHFQQLSQIPRPSMKEEGVREFIRALAKGAGAQVEEDAGGNLLLRVPATQGFEDRPTIMIQGHMDMVCEKNPDHKHDFDRDPIALRIVDNKLFATNTTLGADNGIGLCAGLAAMTDDSVEHPALELLCTANEETGMSGARELDFKDVKATYLLNLDSEELGTFTLGCAGGGDLIGTMNLKRSDSRGPNSIYRVGVNGLRGGHSGIQIHEGRVNAIKTLLAVLKKAPSFELFALQGGKLRNAIPRDAEALVSLDNESKAFVESEFAKLLPTLQASEPNAFLSVEKADCPWNAIEPAQALAIISAIDETVSDVIEWSPDMEGVVKTSNNVGVVTTTEDTLEFTNLARSLDTPEVRRFLEPLQEKLNTAGFTTVIEGEYPGWNPNFDSELLEISQKVHEKVFGERARPVVIHAGLECGLLADKLPPMQMISFGPAIHDAHSPNEHLEIDSVKPFWDLFCGLLISL